MQVAVSYNNEGQITLMFDPAKMRNGKFVMGYKPAEGENHQLLDVPKGLEGKSLGDLGSLLRVNTRGGAPKLETKA